MREVFNIIPPKVRKFAYAAYALLGVALGATQTAYLSLELGQPGWLTVALAVFSYLGIAFGVVALKNTVTPTATITGAHAVAQEDVTG